ncbi:MAG: discoidin domain-containing protein [Phycisphaerae bacterium]|nr:discoidin domain-containing protein [Phycisphaerae bacterium]
MCKIPLSALLLALTAAVPVLAEDQPISLAGQWRFSPDPTDDGIKAAWFRKKLPGQIKLPGSMAENGLGDAVTAETKWTGTVVSRMWHDEDRFAKYRDPKDTKILFWLQPAKHCIGPAWYQRDVEVPDSWRGKHVVLRLERCHWQTRAWIDARFVGTQNSLSVPHEVDLGPLEPGKHTLTLRVDNTVHIDVGVNAHSVSDNTQTNWNGIVGKMELVPRDPIWIDDVQVYPNIERNVASVHIKVRNETGKPAQGTMTLSARSWNTPDSHVAPDLKLPFRIDAGEATVEKEYPLGKDAKRWSEFSPALYRLTATAETRSGTATYRDTKDVTFGLRHFSTDGTQFTLNGRKTFLRGTLECCIFPLTGYPPTDVDSWLRILRIAKAHGLNHLRFHSWCPPEAAFDAADRMGFIYHIECPAWARVGDGKDIDRFIYAEGDRILQAYGNHPSFCMLAYGNEPGGPRHKQYLAKLVDYWKSKDPRRLYTGAAGWPIIPENQYHVTPKPRVHSWGGGLKCRYNAEPLQTRTDYRDFIAQYTVPVVSHEIGQWCVFPNLQETAKYTGVLKARNFEIFRDLLERNHMLDQAKDFLRASGKLQTICYKEEIEAALRTPGFGGFQLLDLHDFPGQGTALVGVIDPFWDSKGYVTPEEYRRFCGPTVPLLRMDKCVWTTDETFVADAEIAHFGPDAIKGANPVWRVTDAKGAQIAAGKLPQRDIPIGNGTPLGPIRLPLAEVKAPAKLSIEVSLEGTPHANAWDLWIYPPRVETAAPQGVLIADSLDDKTVAVLEQGGKVLLLPAPGSVAGDRRGKVPPGFSPIFWNTFWTRNQPPHTLGILCDPNAPALARFPSDDHSNWQWWDLIHDSQIMILDALPKELRPTVQVIDDWNTCRRLGLIFEARLGPGKLLVCGSDLQRNLAARPVARQMRNSLLTYMASDAFAPNVAVTRQALSQLFEKPTAVRRLGATAEASSQEPGYEATNVLDGNEQSIWHTAWTPAVRKCPHWLTVDLKKPVKIQGISVLPRQDMTNGRIGDYAVYLSTDGNTWAQPITTARFASGPKRQEVRFKAPQTCRYVKLEALSAIEPSHPWASVAEFDVILVTK